MKDGAGPVTGETLPDCRASLKTWGSAQARKSGRPAPSNDSPRGFIRRFPSGGMWSCDPGDGQPPPWGLTDVQVDLIRAGNRVTMPDDSTIEWSP